MKNTLILTMLIFFACTPEDLDTNVRDVTLTMTIRDKDNNDFLNPVTMDTSAIRVAYLIDGIERKVNDSLPSPHKGFKISKIGSEYQIAIFTNDKSLSDWPVTHIIWNEEDRDTIYCEVERTTKTITCKKVQYNDKLVWDSSESDERFFSIVKD